MEQIVEPGQNGATSAIAQRLRKARLAALADPEGRALKELLAGDKNGDTADE